jgi:hypothetical protein
MLRQVFADPILDKDDDKLLEEIGYVPSFKREFSNLATVRLILVVFLL